MCNYQFRHGGQIRMGLIEGDIAKPPVRLRKSERREQILLELKLRPHVRISEMAERFGVSAETIRRDTRKLSSEGLINRAHGGASPADIHYPDFDQRSRSRLKERESIGRLAATLVQPGETLMIDSGSTTAQLARFLVYQGTPCTVVTNSLPVAMTLGQSDAAEVIMCPGDYLASEAAVVGVDTLAYLRQFSVDRCLIGAAGLTAEAISDTKRVLTSVKCVMLERCATSHLLIDSEKFGRACLSEVGPLSAISSFVVDRKPTGDIADALRGIKTEVLVAA